MADVASSVQLVLSNGHTFMNLPQLLTALADH